MITRITTAEHRGTIAPPAVGMVWIPGGTFLMGSDDFYPEERPAHHVTVDGFWMDVDPVTNADFRRFVEETGHVTVAERAPDPADYPGVDLALLVAGSLVFRRPPHRVPLHDFRAWWAYLPGDDGMSARYWPTRARRTGRRRGQRRPLAPCSAQLTAGSRPSRGSWPSAAARAARWSPPRRRCIGGLPRRR